MRNQSSVRTTHPRRGTLTRPLSSSMDMPLHVLTPVALSHNIPLPNLRGITTTTRSNNTEQGRYLEQQQQQTNDTKKAFRDKTTTKPPHNKPPTNYPTTERTNDNRTPKRPQQQYLRICDASKFVRSFVRSFVCPFVCGRWTPTVSTTQSCTVRPHKSVARASL